MEESDELNLNLPEICFSTLRTTGELIILKRGTRGYFPANFPDEDRAANQQMAADINQRLGVNRFQKLAMECGSMFGWDVPGADPQSYLDTMELTPVLVERGQLKHPVLSIGYPFKGYLYQNTREGETLSYISMESIHPQLMGEDSDVVILPELLQGKPMVQVKVIFENELAKSLSLADGASTHEQEKIEEYSIMARIRVGDAEFVVGESEKSPSRYGTWKRIPNHERGGQHDFFWGHYYSERQEALQDFEERSREERKTQTLAQRKTPQTKGRER